MRSVVREGRVVIGGVVSFKNRCGGKIALHLGLKRVALQSTAAKHSDASTYSLAAMPKVDTL